MKQLKASVWIMALLAVMLTVGALMSSFGIWDGYNKSPFFLCAVVVFCIVTLWSVFRFPFSWKKIGFFLCHIGIVLVVVCGFISWGCLKETSFSIPINEKAFYGEVMQDDGSELEFGFEISLASFNVEKYEADYRLYKNTTFTPENVLIETVIQNRKGVYDLGSYGSVTVDQLKKDGEYVDSYKLGNGCVLVKLAQVDKSYEGVLQIRDGDVKQVSIGVNRPYTYKGWKFYLMGYDEENLQYVHLYVKKDPANIPFAVGIWMVILGTFGECLPLIYRKGEKK